MDFANAFQTANALGAITMILMGSLALKKHLRSYSG